MRILLLGATGQLGRSFLAAAESGDGLIAASRDGTLADGSRCIATDLAAPGTLPAVLDEARPGVIVNAAAYTAVDRAEQEEALATRINGEAVGRIGAWAAAHGALVVHFSTDYVFDGRARAPYAPDAPTAPINAYGRGKLAGEQALRASGAAHFILRTGWVYAAHGANFLRTMLRLAATRDELRVVADQHGAPTDTALLVQATHAALARWRDADAAARRALEGTHHVVASGVTTWHGFAAAIFAQAHALGLLARVPRVIPVASSQYPASALRPAWSVLDNRGFQRHFDFPLPDWQQRLPGVLRELRDATPRP